VKGEKDWRLEGGPERRKLHLHLVETEGKTCPQRVGGFLRGKEKTMGDELERGGAENVKKKRGTTSGGWELYK